ncbi:hypothetical protein ACJJTC_008513 [Scirpophaga incertulas]
MFEFELYAENVVTTDTNALENIQIDKSVLSFGLFKANHCDENSNDVRPLATAVIGLNNTVSKYSENIETSDLWTDIDVQDFFLKTKSNCYLIISKPGAGSYTIGEAMAKTLNCIHFCPFNVIQDEIQQCGATGNCLKFNLKQGKVVKYDTIMSIIKSKMLSPAVKHRGFVLSGLPLVSILKNTYLFSHKLYTEESLQIAESLLLEILDYCTKKYQTAKSGGSHSSLSTNQGTEEEIEDINTDENLEEQNGEQPVILPQFILNTCKDIIVPKNICIYTLKSELLKQLHELFNITMQPDIIINILISDRDLILKRMRKYIIYSDNHLKPNTESESRPRITVNINPKYKSLHPLYFNDNSISQICNYEKVSTFISQKLQEFSPRQIIRLDARESVHEMMFKVTERLTVLLSKISLIPQPLYIEQPPDEMEEFWNLITESNVIKSGRNKFNRFPSLWYNRCPVELKNRHSVRGHPKYAVSFFNHVYLMSSLDAMILFCRNPRPYLKLEYLEPTCRIFVMGTKKSGKTMISNCFSWLFNGPIISYNEYVQHEKHMKYARYSNTILSEIIATIEDTRFSQWQHIEDERVRMLNHWLVNVTDNLKIYITVFKNILKYNQNELDETINIDNLFNKYNLYKSRLFGLPFLEDIDQCIKVFEDQTLINFAPVNLTNVKEKPDVPKLGDEDVTAAIEQYIVINDLQNEITPTNEEIITGFCNILSKIDEKTKEEDSCYGKYIVDDCPSDPEFWKVLADLNLLPDNTIALIENREVDENLLQKYKDIDSGIRNNSEIFLLANDPLIKIKLQNTNSPTTSFIDVELIIDQIVTKVILTVIKNGDSNPVSETSGAGDELESIEIFSTSLDKFREDIEPLKLRLEESFKSFIQVDLDDKTDIQIIEEVLLKLRKSYYLTSQVNTGKELEQSDELEYKNSLDSTATSTKEAILLCETSRYCPVAFYDYGVLWEGRPEISLIYDNKVHLFCNDQCLDAFQKDITKYQEYCKPFKKMPPLRLCVIGCIGSGKSTLSKNVAKELGLIHIDFMDFLNNNLLPKHYKKVGKKYENPFTEQIIIEENSKEFQLDEDVENIAFNIMGNETELRRMLYNYFEIGTPILPELMQCLIKKLWFDSPYTKTGFVLDGYPKITSDVNDMVACYCIPDLVIQLECDINTAEQRLSQNMLKTWKTQLLEAKQIANIKHDHEMLTWSRLITKTIVIKLILEEILDNIFVSIDKPVNNMDLQNESHESLNILESMDFRLLTLYNEITEEYPSPIKQNEWETSEEALEKIESRIQGVFEAEDECLQLLKDSFAESMIKSVTIDSTKTIKLVFRNTLLQISNLKRYDSFFEQTFVINYETANNLLSEGFFFLSKFKRMCPVYILENPKTITNPYNRFKQKNDVYPVVHRSYIYYTFGKENCKKFRSNPLKYVSCKNIDTFQEYPLCVGIIGSPKCGKSVLANKIASQYGLICISRGMALRYTLENLHWTELASYLRVSLCKGAILKPEYIIKAVQNVMFDHRVTTNGFIFDGFPETTSEAMELINAGIYPSIIIDISNNLEKSLMHSQYDVGYNLKENPPYSIPFISNKYEKWKDRNNQIRTWIKNDIQNIYVVDGNRPKWRVLQESVRHIENIILKIHNYLTNVSSNIVLASCMCISDKIFQERMTVYKNLCPVCYHSNKYRHSGHPVDKSGVVQFMNKFYWICNDHIELVLKYPNRYLLNHNIDIKEIPVAVNIVNQLDVYENGICVVTYAKSLPSQNIVQGCNKYAASFQGKTYIFCSSKCLDEFLEKPHLYSDITILKNVKTLPEIVFKQLPNLGYLEQAFASRVPVPDERFDYLCDFHKPASKVPAFLNVVDIAGLVRGAAEGQGLGNAFLSHIKACDAIFNLCRAFDDEDVIHVDGDVNPVRDLETIGEELRLKDEEQLVQNFEKLDRVVNRGGDKKLKPEYDALTRIKAILVEEKKHIRFGDWSAADIEVLNKYLFLTSKPALYLVNLSEKDYIRKKNKWLPKLKEWIDKNDPGAPLIPFSGVLETKLLEMDPAEKQAFLKEHNITSALDKIIVQGYKALQLEYFFTAGPDEVKAWTIQKGTKAPQAAGRIHTDFEKGFIMAEVMHYKDFKEEGSEAACKAAGKYRQQGRNYVVEDGDIIFFKFNAGAGLKDAKKK